MPQIQIKTKGKEGHLSCLDSREAPSRRLQPQYEDLLPIRNGPWLLHVRSQSTSSCLKGDEHCVRRPGDQVPGVQQAKAELQLSREVRSLNPPSCPLGRGDPAADPPVGIRPLHNQGNMPT